MRKIRKTVFSEEMGISESELFDRFDEIADHFLGCDSVGQHLAYIGGTEATVVIGATFPVNTSYPKTEKIHIVDMGQIDREYDPIRITNDEQVSRHNEKLMWMTDEVEDYVVNVVLGKQKTDEEENE